MTNITLAQCWSLPALNIIQFVISIESKLILAQNIFPTSTLVFSLFKQSSIKNLNSVEKLLYSLNAKLAIIGITETKLSEHSVVVNTNIPSYNLFYTNSLSNADRAALKVAKCNLKATSRPDIAFTNCEIYIFGNLNIYIFLIVISISQLKNS